MTLKRRIWRVISRIVGDHRGQLIVWRYWRIATHSSVADGSGYQGCRVYGDGDPHGYGMGWVWG